VIPIRKTRAWRAYARYATCPRPRIDI